MKKILLLTALMAGAMTVNAQSDFKVKELAKLPVTEISGYDGGSCRSAYGFNDKLYLVDRASKKLRVFNILTKEEVGQVEIGANNAMGHDEAGNAIIGNWGWAGTAVKPSTTFTLISADLTKKVTTNETTCVRGRTDLLGKAKGNVFGAEGATLLAAGILEDVTTGFASYTFSGGDEPTVEYNNVSEYLEDGDTPTIVAGSSSLVFNYFKDLDGTDHYLYVNRSLPIIDFTFDDGTVSSITKYDPEDRITRLGVNNGADIFVLGNRKFMVYPHSTTDTEKNLPKYRDGFSIVEINDDNTLTQVFRQESTLKVGEIGSQINWLWVEVLNEKQAKLYQYFRDGYAAEYGIAINGADTPTGVTGIENADAKAVSTTYYTPAGVASKTAVKGLNIVVTKYADGSQKVVKVIK